MEKYLPLFPLDVVLFPDMILPLHIFEERYKEMIGECVQNRIPFGLLYAHDESMEDVGCQAEVTKVLKKYQDGRMDILTLGRQRFQVIYFDNEKSYLRGIVEPYFDSESVEPPSEEDAQQMLRAYQNVYRLLNKSDSEPIEDKPPYQGLSFKIASVLNLNNSLKQQILVERSERNRVDTLVKYLADLIPRLEQAERAARQAGSNGNLFKNLK
jgi:Lon protease-like protein